MIYLGAWERPTASRLPTHVYGEELIATRAHFMV
jgi:hypothetical protein